jgi:GT2 family glycosyltransferase
MKEIEQKWAACIVYYQDQESLNNLLESLENQSLKPSSVFIADNNSNEPLKLNNYSFPVNVFRLAQNKGFAGGANVAVNKAMENNFNNFILLSQDVLIEISAAEKIIEKLTENSGIVFPTMMNRNTNTVFSKGGLVNKLTGKISLITDDSAKEIDWADGSCLAFNSVTFRAVNGLCEKYFMYFEDVDFCLSAKRKGFSLTHVEVVASQTPKGPSPMLRSRNSLILARRTKSALFVSSVTKRNLLGAFLLFARLRPQDAFNRLRGIFQGLVVKFD